LQLESLIEYNFHGYGENITGQQAI